MDKINVALVAANDRNNYGDILLPKIVEKYADKHGLRNIDFNYFSTSNNDLTNLGGNKTVEISKIPYDTRAIIIVGGEVLNVNYTSTYLFLQKNIIKVYLGRLIRKLFKNKSELFFRKRLHYALVH